MAVTKDSAHTVDVICEVVRSNDGVERRCDMERLTIVDEDGTILCIGCAEEEECNGDCLNCQHDIDAIKKLAEYEDLEEQGLLLRLDKGEKQNE